MVLSTERAMPVPLVGDEVIGRARFWQSRGRNCLGCEAERTRCMRRLYAAINSVLKLVFRSDAVEFILAFLWR